jgi:hypothetical protein
VDLFADGEFLTMKMRWSAVRIRPAALGIAGRRHRGLRGGTYGGAGKVRRLSPEECRVIEDQMRRDGVIGNEKQGTNNG